MTLPTLTDLQNIADEIMAPREIVRDPDGMLIRPEIPTFDEGVDMRPFFAAIGIDVRFISMEDDCEDQAVLEACFEDGVPGCGRWTPTHPEGDGWLLLEIFETEDGPCAMFGRRDPMARLRYAAPVQQVERQELSAAAGDVLAERRRQIEQEGRLPDEDDTYVCGEIAAYATFYAMPPAVRDWPATETGYGDTWGEAIIPADWTEPKPGDRRRELVKAGALILAEIERLDRAKDRGQA